MNETFKLSSKNGADLNIYVLDRTYDYQLWETDLSHDISSDSYLGNGTIKRPVGLIITVSKIHKMSYYLVPFQIAFTAFFCIIIL